MRVIVTGSREYSDRGELWGKLDAMLTFSHGDLEVIHGDCPTGADRFAHEWCEAMKGLGATVKEDPHPARWDLHGKKAGPIRNTEMVHLPDVDFVLAFYQPGAKNMGTHDCVIKAHYAGLEVFRY